MQTLYHVKVEGSRATVETLAWGGSEVSSITEHLDGKTDEESRSVMPIFGSYKCWRVDPKQAIVDTLSHHGAESDVDSRIARIQIADLLLVLLKMGQFGQGATVTLDQNESGQNVAAAAPPNDCATDCDCPEATPHRAHSDRPETAA